MSMYSVALMSWPVLREGRGGRVLCGMIHKTQKRFPLPSYTISPILHSSEGVPGLMNWPQATFSCLLSCSMPAGTLHSGLTSINIPRKCHAFCHIFPLLCCGRHVYFSPWKVTPSFRARLKWHPLSLSPSLRMSLTLVKRLLFGNF